ncbi:MAG: FGGY-family carbohydrate kinase [Oscillospiraceae bacterium]|nr:FGGY-family carbohydrate kinase [Oscillospiraceae bacterium]
MKVFLGIELGSTRIKAVAIDQSGKPLASGGFDWENRFENSVWTYRLEDAWHGIRESLTLLFADYREKHNGYMPEIGGMGVSAMMHGYLVFDKDYNQLTDFRTWRNTMTEVAANRLTDLFKFKIPQRWSIAHIYHAVSAKESHINDVKYLTTLAGYIHYKLTGENVVGTGEASGMFPLDNNTGYYDLNKVKQYEELVAEYNLPWKITDVLPKVLVAGENAGYLTEEGAKLLDPTGNIKPGVPLCPPEGDAGTGMVATNTIVPGTGNISAGTSIFAILVLEDALKKFHKDIDILASPSGKPAVMVHCINGTGDLDGWMNMFADMLTQMGKNPDMTELYRTLYNAALKGDSDAGGLVSVNYLAGEYRTGFSEGRPLVARTPDSKFTVENFMRTLLLSTVATVRIGIEPLIVEEEIELSKIVGHGGFFKTAVVGQKLMAGALNIPVAVMETAGDGGAWGVALLAAYSVVKDGNETLEDFLNEKIFADSKVSIIEPDSSDVDGFNVYLERYRAALHVERAAVENL